MIDEVIVIGGGPAAMSAVLYLSQLNRQVRWIFGYSLGGQIQTTEIVENYLGFQGRRAPDLLTTFAEQTKDLALVKQVFGEVVNLEKSDGIFTVYTDMDETYQSKTVLVATGASPRKLGVPGEEDLTSNGVSYCAICDAPLFVGADVVVVGGGTSAFENADILSRFANSVTIIHRNETFKANNVLVQKVSELENVKILTNTSITKIGEGNEVQYVDIIDNQTGKTNYILTDGVFVSIGLIPATDFLQEMNEKENQNFNLFGFLIEGYLNVAGNGESIYVDGLFGAGDVTDSEVKQIIVAAGSGANAAVGIDRYLTKEG